MKIHIHTGPGPYDKILLEQLTALGLAYSYTSYWPKFRFASADARGKLLTEHGSFIYDKLSYLLYGIWGHLPILNRKQGHLDILFRTYDRLCSSHLPSDLDVLVAWAQVSLFSMRKAKKAGTRIILEHPMVHVNTWMQIMKEEYERYSTETEIKYSLFTDSMVTRMLHEYEEADVINVLSTFSKKTFVQNGIPEKKVRVTLPGIDTGFWQCKPQQKPKFIYLFAGRLELLKGVHYLLEAFGKLQDDSSELWLAGRVLPEIEPYLKKYNHRNIKVWGPKSREDLREMMQKASVFILPSVQESFGFVLIEALACGLPLIATENTGGPDVIVSDLQGMLIKPGSMTDLKNAMERMRSDQKLNAPEQCEARSVFVKERFVTKCYKERWNSLLNDISQ